MRSANFINVLILAALVVVGGVVAQQQTTPSADPPLQQERTLKYVTMNTQAYDVPGNWQRETRSIKIEAKEDMHIVAVEHFVGVTGGNFGDNGHIFSTNPDNPWVKWEGAGTGMEPNDTPGYFGYCGRDYYCEVGGIQDVMAYETFPAGTHVLVRKGETLYMHCYACIKGGQAHHMARILYW